MARISPLTIEEGRRRLENAVREHKISAFKAGMTNGLYQLIILTHIPLNEYQSILFPGALIFIAPTPEEALMMALLSIEGNEDLQAEAAFEAMRRLAGAVEEEPEEYT